MVEVAETMLVDGSTDQVWTVLADFGEIARWAPNVHHSCLTTDQTTGVGCVRRVQVGRNALLERVIEWQEQQRLSYAIEGLPPVVRSAVNTWAVEVHGDATMVTLTTEIDAGPRPPQQLVARVFAKVMAKASLEMLGGLKTYVGHVASAGARS